MNIAWEGGASTSYFERLTRTWGEGKIVLHLPIIGILGYSLLSQSIPLNIAWEGGASTSYFERLTRTWGEGKIVLHLPIIGILGYSLLSQSIPLNIAWEDGASTSYFKRRRRTWGEGKIVELGGTFANFRICCWSNSGVLWSILCFQFWFLKTDMWH